MLFFIKHIESTKEKIVLYCASLKFLTKKTVTSILVYGEDYEGFSQERVELRKIIVKNTLGPKRISELVGDSFVTNPILIKREIRTRVGKENLEMFLVNGYEVCEKIETLPCKEELGISERNEIISYNLELLNSLK